MKVPAPEFKHKICEYLGFERKFLRYAQRYDFARALLEATEIRLADAAVTLGDLRRAGFSQHPLRRVQVVVSSLLDAAGSEAVEFRIEKSLSPARAWTRLKDRYAPSTSSQIAGIQRCLHKTRADDTEDPIPLLSMYEEKKVVW